MTKEQRAQARAVCEAAKRQHSIVRKDDLLWELLDSIIPAALDYIEQLEREIMIALKTCPNGGNDGYITPRPCQCEVEGLEAENAALQTEIAEANRTIAGHILIQKKRDADHMEYAVDSERQRLHWQARAEAAETELDDVRAHKEALERFKAYWHSLYGQGLEIANWHMNGSTEPFDNFYDSAEMED